MKLKVITKFVFRMPGAIQVVLGLTKITYGSVKSDPSPFPAKYTDYHTFNIFVKPYHLLLSFEAV